MGVIDLDARVKKLEQGAGSSGEIDQIEADLTALENTVAEMSTYSDTEHVVGTWIDEKPIYEKVATLELYLDNTTHTSEATWINSGVSSTGIETIVSLVLMDGDGQPINPNIAGILSATSTLGFKANTNVDGRTITKLIVRYTKTSTT